MNEQLQTLSIFLHRLQSRDRQAPDCDQARLAPVLLDAIEVPVFVIDHAGVVACINAAWQRIMGYTIAGTLGTALADYIHPHDREMMREFLQSRQEVNAGDKTVRIRHLTRAGDCRHFDVHVSAITGAAGEPLGHIGTLSDATRRVHAQELRDASHRTLETLIHNLPGMVYRCRNNPEWTMEFVSDGVRALTGHAPEDFINNKRLPFASLIVSADQRQVWDTVQVCLREHRPFELTYRIHTASGQEKWVLERGRGNFSSNGELLSLEGFITDITVEKRAELRREQDALYDSATDLPTRALFTDRLDMALRRPRLSTSTDTALLLIYLDRFAKLRIRFGKEFSDRVALDAGRKLRRVLGPADSICRWHEDEFAVLLDCAGSQSAPAVDAAAVARRIQESLYMPIVDGERETLLTASIGIVTSLAHYSRADDAWHDVTAALVRARELGGARYEIHDRKSRTQVLSVS